MDIEREIQTLAERASKHASSIQTEEATKTALVMPFLQMLGYNIFNPSEVIPEYCADVGIKKGEKVDYALLNNEKISILIECKTLGNNLSIKHASQLYRYFSVTEAKFAILTNGVNYNFYSDLRELNKMDDTPFFTFDINKFDEHGIASLKKFEKNNFNVEKILDSASTLLHLGAIKNYIQSQFNDPSDEFVKIIGKNVYSGKLMASVIEEFRPLESDSKVFS